MLVVTDANRLAASTTSTHSISHHPTRPRNAMSRPVGSVDVGAGDAIPPVGRRAVEPGDAITMVGRVAEGPPRAPCALQEDADVVLVGHADPAVHLHALV